MAGQIPVCHYSGAGKSGRLGGAEYRFCRGKGQYITFPDIDDVIHPQMYGRLLEIALAGKLDVATCNGTYVYEDGREPRPIFPPDRLRSTGVLSGPDWLKRALNSRKFLHVTG